MERRNDMEISLLTLRTVGRKLGMSNVSGFRKPELLQQVMERLEAKGKTLDEFASEQSISARKGYTKKKLNIKPLGENPYKKGSISFKVWEELAKNDGRSFSKIAKEVGTYYNVVSTCCRNHFQVI